MWESSFSQSLMSMLRLREWMKSKEFYGGGGLVDEG